MNPQVGDRTQVRMEFPERVGVVRVYVIAFDGVTYTGQVLSWSSNLNGIVINGDKLRFKASEIHRG